MLAKDVQITGIDPAQYERLTLALQSVAPEQKDRTLFVFFQENRAFHAVHSELGPIDAVNFKGPGSLERLAVEHDVDRVICVEAGAVRRVFTKAQASLKHGQRLWDQILACRTALMMEMNSGVHIYPDPFKALPVIPDYAIRLARMLIPGELLIGAVVIDQGKVWTSLQVSFEKGEITLITTTDSLEGMDREFQDVRAAAEAITAGMNAKWGRPTAGAFMEKAAFEQLLSSPKPLYAFADLVKKQWIYVKPFPVRLKVILALISILKNNWTGNIVKAE